MSIKDYSVNHETAILARHKGFKEECGSAWEWYEFGGQVYGPVPVGKALFEIQTYSPAERAVMDDQLYKERSVNFATSFAVLHYSNRTLPPWLFACPTQSLLARWLREVHQLHVNVYPELGKWEINVFSFVEKECMFHSGDEDAKDTYEQGMEAALQEALKLLPDVNA